MKIKELFVSVEAKVKGLKKLEDFNNALKGIMASYKELYKVSNQVSQTSEKSGSSLFGKFFAVAPNIAAVMQIAKSIYGVVKALVSFSLNMSKSAYELIKLRNNLGLSTTKLQEFGNAAVASGVKLGDFQSAVATLRKQSIDILLGRGDITPYALLGLNPHDDPMVFLEKLQGRLRELPEALGTAFATDLGLSPDMINFVRSADFRRLRERPTLSQREINQMKELRDSALELVVAFQTFGQKMVVSFSPIIKNIFEPLTKHFQAAIKNTYLLKKDLVALLYGAALGAASFNRTLAATIAIGTTIGIIVEDLIKGGKGIKLWILDIKYMLLDAIDELGQAFTKWFKFGKGANLGTGATPVAPFASEGQAQAQLGAANWIRLKALFAEKTGVSWIDDFKEWLSTMVVRTYSPEEIAGGLVPPTKLEMSYEGGGIPIVLNGAVIGEVPLENLRLNVPSTDDTTVSGVK